MNTKILTMTMMIIMHSVADLLISSISLTNDTISQVTDYQFQIVRYGTIVQIPTNTKVQISFPNQYAYSSVTSCVPIDWVGATTLSCSYSQLKLTISGGFSANSSIQDFSFQAHGITNPSSAKSYSPFSVRLIFPNATSENGTGYYSVTITTALATCSMSLSSGVVFGQGLMTINYQSQYINNSGVGYLMKLSMLQSYPSDPTNTDVNPILSVSNTMLSKYLFEFSFVSTFNLTMKMPPSTQPELNFIYLMTSNVLGDYDKCYISIRGVQPNTFQQLSFSGAQVQSLSNLQINFLSNTPILQTDLIRINFQNSDFDISQVSSYATFINGAVGQRQVTITNQTITISSISSFIIVSQVGFILNNVKFPYSNKIQYVTFYIQTDNGYIRDKRIYYYSSNPGTLINPSFTCLINQIGYTTSCTLGITLKNQIKNTSYIQIQFASGFRISNGYSLCITSGNNLNTISNCNSYALTNSIRVTGLISNGSIPASTFIQVTISSLTLPTRPDQYILNISTRTSTDSIIDTNVFTFVTISRLLLSSEISISSSQVTTSTISNFMVTFTLPISLGVPYTLSLYIPFTNVSSVSVNSNLLQSSYSSSTSTLTIQNVGNTAMIITGFQTYQSTSPVTLSGNLTYNNTLYFYFTGYDIVMTNPKQINVFNFGQSNQIVGRIFRADMVISDLKVNDIIKIPSAYYALAQTDCSTNCLCSSNGKIVIQSTNNYGTNLTKITTNLLNNGYISSTSFDLFHYDPTGIFYKQYKTVIINTQVLNVLNITATQTNPYFTEISTYTFDVTMTTIPPSSSLINILAVKVPPQYTVQDWSCIFGCTAPQPPITQNTIYFQFSSINLKFTIKLTNPVSFLSAFQMTSSSLGDMDYGTYTPVSPCQSPCRSCDVYTTSFCLSCYLWKSENKLRNGTCVSNCSVSQYYQNSTLSCQACNNYCLSCVNTSTTCYTCKTGYYYFQLSCLIDCPAAYYKTSTYQCGNCQANCLNCTSDTNCTKCQTGSYLYSQSCWASCQQGTYINPIANQCLNCSQFCTTCDFSGCSLCTDNYYLYNKKCYLNCPTGLYKNITTCQACQVPCSSCSIFSTNCTSCVISSSSINYYYLNNKCFPNNCPDTYYVSPLDNSCLQCQYPCLTCNRTSCLLCQSNLFYYNGYCSTQCQFGTYHTANLSCVQCVTPCSSCQSSNSCLSCFSPYFLYNSTCILSCPDKFYQGDNICKACISPCFTCSSQTICKSCLALSFFNGTCLSTCPFGYYSTSVLLINNTVYKCVACVSPCQSCISETLCLTCMNGLKLFNNTCQASCPAFYYDQNGMCFICSYPCETCNSSGCLTCATSNLYLQLLSCRENCSTLHPNNQTMICQACKSPCASCTWSDTCLSCQSGFIYYGQQCIRTCPSGMYNNNYICVTCPSLCSTCYLFGDQIRCPTCKEGNYFYGYDCVSACPNTTKLQDPFCLSASCSSLTDCLTCSNLRCLQCNTNFTLNTNTQKCQAIVSQTSTISAISQIPVPFPFLIATALIIISAFLIRLSFDKMFAPLFIYSFVGIAECGVIALWIGLIYLRGINTSQTGTVLKIAATALAGIYVLFNIIGFIFYLKVTKNDKKFRTWQKQDNKCTSIAISIVALIFSFRFSILKYSKLGHLLRFSATLSHDQKLSHQNLLSFLAIFLINIPTVVVSAWVAYLQITMNYLFFTSIQVSVLSVIMIVLSIIQSLSPKGYTLEKKQDFKQGKDVDSIDDHSLSEMMVKLGIVQQQYHEGKQILSQQEVGNKNSILKNEDQYEGDGTREALMFPKKQDEKLSLQSEIQSDNEKQSENQNDSIQAKTEEIREQLENILMEAEKRAESLNRPSRPIGTIKKQTLRQLFENQESSEGIQSDDQPPPINNVKTVRINKDSPLKKQETLDLKQLKNFLQIQQRRLGMRKLEHLFQKLKMQQQQQKQLMHRLQKVTEQQKRVKKQQYDRARQLIERNQMQVQQKITKVQKLMEKRNQNEKQRKQKIKQLEKKRKQDRVSRTAEKSVKKNLIYPIHQQINQSGLGEKNVLIQSKKDKQISFKNKQVQESQWTQQANQVVFNQNQWRMTSQRMSPSLFKNQQTLEQRSSQLKPDKQQTLEHYEQIPHWPLDPELQEKINEVQGKAQMYIKKPRPSSEIEEYDMDLSQEPGTGGQQILFNEQQGSAFNQDENERKAQQQIIQNIDSVFKKPKRRINRSVINLAPEQ